MQVPQGDEVNEYEESYDLDEMDDAEKNELILRLFDDLSTTNIVAIGLHNAMISLSTGLLQGDVLGSRARTMRSIALRMAARCRSIEDNTADGLGAGRRGRGLR